MSSILHNLHKHRALIACVLVIAILVLPEVASASASGGTPNPGTAQNAFDELYTYIKALLSGSLGKLLTILSLAVSLIIGIKMNSIMGALTTFAIAMACIYGPGVFEGMFTATLSQQMASPAIEHVVAPSTQGTGSLLPMISPFLASIG